MQSQSLMGQVLTCHETGKRFLAARDGVSMNYATDSEGRTYSDEGVDLCERRGLLDRSHRSNPGMAIRLRPMKPPAQG